MDNVLCFLETEATFTRERATASQKMETFLYADSINRSHPTVVTIKKPYLQYENIDLSISFDEDNSQNQVEFYPDHYVSICTKDQTEVLLKTSHVNGLQQAILADTRYAYKQMQRAMTHTYESSTIPEFQPSNHVFQPMNNIQLQQLANSVDYSCGQYIERGNAANNEQNHKNAAMYYHRALRALSTANHEPLKFELYIKLAQSSLSQIKCEKDSLSLRARRLTGDAINYFEQALICQPGHPFIYSALAHTYYHYRTALYNAQEQTSRAIDLYQLAIQNGYHNSQIYKKLGDSYKASGKELAANKCYNKLSTLTQQTTPTLQATTPEISAESYIQELDGFLAPYQINTTHSEILGRTLLKLINLENKYVTGINVLQHDAQKIVLQLKADYNVIHKFNEDMNRKFGTTTATMIPRDKVQLSIPQLARHEVEICRVMKSFLDNPQTLAVYQYCQKNNINAADIFCKKIEPLQEKLKLYGINSKTDAVETILVNMFVGNIELPTARFCPASSNYDDAVWTTHFLLPLSSDSGNMMINNITKLFGPNQAVRSQYSERLNQWPVCRIEISNLLFEKPEFLNLFESTLAKMAQDQTSLIIQFQRQSGVARPTGYRLDASSNLAGCSSLGTSRSTMFGVPTGLTPTCSTSADENLAIRSNVSGTGHTG